MPEEINLSSSRRGHVAFCVSPVWRPVHLPYERNGEVAQDAVTNKCDCATAENIVQVFHAIRLGLALLCLQSLLNLRAGLLPSISSGTGNSIHEQGLGCNAL